MALVRSVHTIPILTVVLKLTPRLNVAGPFGFCASKDHENTVAVYAAASKKLSRYPKHRLWRYVCLQTRYCQKCRFPVCHLCSRQHDGCV